MNPRISLEVDLDSQKPKQEVFLGLGLVKSTIFFIISYIILSGTLKKGINGFETIFIGIVIIGTFYIFLRKYDSDEVEAYTVYLLSSVWFWLFSRGIKKLNTFKDIGEDYFVLQNGGFRAVIEVSPSIELSSESSDRVEQLIGGYSRLLETFGQYFQLVARIRKVPSLYLVLKAFGTDETIIAQKYLEEFERHGVMSLKIYIVLAADPAKWFYLENNDVKRLKKQLEEHVSSCMGFLSRAEFVAGYKRLKGTELIDFVFDENFYQNRDSVGKKDQEPVLLDKISQKLHEKVRTLKHKAMENRRISDLLASERYQDLSLKAEESLTWMREFFQIPESDIHPALRTVEDFHVTRDSVYCNGVYIKNLLLKFLPEREPALIVRELLRLNQNIDVSFHFYPDQGKRIRKILGHYYKTITDQIDEMKQRGNVSLTSVYQEARLKETYYASLGGKNLFLATVLVTVYDLDPRRLNAGVELVKKALRPAGLVTEALTFNQEQAFLFRTSSCGGGRREVSANLMPRPLYPTGRCTREASSSGVKRNLFFQNLGYFLE